MKVDLQLKTEIKENLVMLKQLKELNSRVINGSLAVPLSERRVESIQYHISELSQLLQACNVNLESALDDLENEG